MMLKKSFNITLLFGLLLASIFVACKPETVCRQVDSTFLRLSVECDSLTANGELVKFTHIDSITVKGQQNDSIIYDNENITSFMLPLRKDTTVTKFDMIVNGLTEVMVIEHQNRDHYISLACGCVVVHTIDTIYGENGVITDCKITNSSIGNNDDEHGVVYFSF